MSLGTFLISGIGFRNTTNVVLGDTTCNYKVLSDNLVTGTIPDSAMSGDFLISTYAGTNLVSSNYPLTYQPITISGFYPFAGSPGDQVTISGSNFYRVSKVLFSNITGQYVVLNSGYIQAILPTGAVSGLIKVISSGKNLSGVSRTNFVPNPTITGFYPGTGVAGNTVYISGFNLNSMFSVKFNDINATGSIILDNKTIRSFVPTGNTFGKVKVIGYSGATGISSYDFQPIASIYKVFPNTGSYGGVAILSGTNLETGFMYNLGGNAFGINFNGVLSPFYRRSSTSMTGIIRTTSSGPVQLFKPDGATLYPGSGSFSIVTVPIIYRRYQTTNSSSSSSATTASSNALYPAVFNSGSYLNLSILGVGFNNITGITFSGYTTGIGGAGTGERFYVTGNRIVTDASYTRINITGYLLSGIQYHTGFYRVSISNNIGLTTFATGFDSGIRIL